MIDGLLATLAKGVTDSAWLAPVFAFVAGVFASFLPCSLSSIPLIIGYVGGSGEEDTKKAFKFSIVFAVGAAVTYTALGVAAATAGKLLGTSSKVWFIFLGALMVLMALQMWGVFEIIPSSYLTSKNTKKGYLGAFITGLLGGVFATPCSTPVLVAVLAVVAGKGSIAWGAFLLLLYALGHGILAVIAGTSVGFVRKMSADPKYGKWSKALNVVFGLLILAIGFYMFYLGF